MLFHARTVERHIQWTGIHLWPRATCVLKIPLVFIQFHIFCPFFFFSFINSSLFFSLRRKKNEFFSVFCAPIRYNLHTNIFCGVAPDSIRLYRSMWTSIIIICCPVIVVVNVLRNNSVKTQVMRHCFYSYRYANVRKNWTFSPWCFQQNQSQCLNRIEAWSEGI